MNAQIRIEMNRLNEIQATIIKDAQRMGCTQYELRDGHHRIPMLDVVMARSNLMLADAIERSIKK